nr:hypothetical protein [Tanacetum cinerariifolium]
MHISLKLLEYISCIRHKDTSRRTIPVEASTLNSLVSQSDGVGSYDWSFQADEEPTSYALMAFTSSGSSSSSGSDREKDYPLTDAVMILMMSTKLQVNEDCEIARDLVMKIFMKANKPKSKRSLDTSSK